ncbi:MAG: cellulase family glycosylhydrolase [bacterium]|nr:cellulase family glycosylhydrolase [bacterium]
MPEPTAAKLPRWRGFNLLEKFTLRQNAPYQERDFQWMKDWGFDFVRLPMDYRCWTNQEKPDEYDEGVLKHIDQAVEFGKQYGVHINLNLHRGPGYCVNPPKEPLNLWKDDEALRQFTRQWKSFAERYKGISSAQVSFDLLNEPPGDLDEATYARVMTATVEAIRSADPERLVVVDGLSWGQKPVMSLADLGIGQSTRGYNPFQISHYKASWINGSDKWDVPTWPLKTQSGEQDKQWLYDRFIAPWKALEEKGCGVHVGEWGAYNRTPHDVVLAWMKDCTALWKDAGWGWSLWNLRGAFGVADSGREDVAYEDFDGHKLDRKMLELLKAS